MHINSLDFFCGVVREKTASISGAIRASEHKVHKWQRFDGTGVWPVIFCVSAFLFDFGLFLFSFTELAGEDQVLLRFLASVISCFQVSWSG